MMERQSKKTNTTRRRHKIYIQVKTTSTPDGRGGFNYTWTDSIGPIWASVDPLRASKVAEYKSTNVHATHLINMNAKFNVSELNRIRFGSRIFEIVASENLQERNIVRVVTVNEVRS